MSYIAFDPASPDGTTQDGPTVLDKILHNEHALRDGILMGGMDGFDYATADGTPLQPAKIYFKDGVGGSAPWLLGEVVWTANKVSQIDWSKSLDGGSTYDPICSMVPTYDGNGNLTSTSGGGAGVGLVAMLNAGANGVAREPIAELIDGNASNTLDWSRAGFASLTVTGSSAVIAFANLPDGELGTMLLEITNGGLATSGSTLLPGATWLGGSVPALNSSGLNVISCYCYDGSTVKAQLVS